MDLFLLRHGPAVERGTPGFENDGTRPLTPKGRRQSHKIAKAMRAMGLEFELVWSSPLVRARQTADIVAAGLELKDRCFLAEELSPGGNAGKLIQKIGRLKPAPKNILLVGHEPGLGELASRLVTGAAGAGFALKKNGLAKLEAEILHNGKCAALAWLLTPGQMKLMH